MGFKAQVEGLPGGVKIIQIWKFCARENFAFLRLVGKK